MSNIEYDIEDDIAYQEGEERGIEKGVKKGKIEGKIEGDIKRSIIGIRNFTAKNLSADLIAEGLALELKFVKDIQKQLLLTDKITTLLEKKQEPKAIVKKLKVNELLVAVLKEEMEKK